jgi:ABC-type lipoprotein release transport system permease subunit
MTAYIRAAASRGMGVSLVAAILPAMRAAKMPPAAALSTEV